MKQIFAYVLNYLTLFVLAVFFAVAMPAAGFAEQVVRGLTSEKTYVELVRSAGLAKSAREIFDGATKKIIESVPGLSDTSLSAGLEEINQALTKAVDEAIVEVASQVPAYVTGRRDHLQAEVDLSSVRAIAVATAKKSIPGANLLGGYVEKAVEAKIPQGIPLDSQLSTLELLLKPVRVMVTSVLSKLGFLKGAAWFCLGLMVLVAFRLARAAGAVGFASLLCGTSGYFSSHLVQKLFSVALPVEVLNNQVFKLLISSSVSQFKGSSNYWILIGAVLLVLSIGTPLTISLVKKRLGSRKSSLLAFAFPKGERASLVTLIGLVPTLLGLALGRTASKPRLAARAVLGGRLAAATVLDYLLLPLLITGLSEAIKHFAGLSFAGGLFVLPLWFLLVVFWFFRDRPKTLGGFNFIDRLAGIRRAKKPGRAIHVASIRRATILFAALLVSVFVPACYAFPAFMLAELIALCALWPDRTIADLIAGTRARLFLGRNLD